MAVVGGKRGTTLLALPWSMGQRERWSCVGTLGQRGGRRKGSGWWASRCGSASNREGVCVVGCLADR